MTCSILIIPFLYDGFVSEERNINNQKIFEFSEEEDEYEENDEEDDKNEEPNDMLTVRSWVESLTTNPLEHEKLICFVTYELEKARHYSEFQTIVYAHVDFFIDVIATSSEKSMYKGKIDDDMTSLSASRKDNGSILFSIYGDGLFRSYFSFYPNNADRSLGGIESYVRYITSFSYNGHDGCSSEKYKQSLTTMLFEALQPNANWISVMTRSLFYEFPM